MKKCKECPKELKKRQESFCSRECFFMGASWKKTQRKPGEVSSKKGMGVGKKELDRRYYEKNKEALKLKMREYYKNNKELFQVSSKNWAENNKDKIKISTKKWRDNNKASRQSWCYKRRALKRSAVVETSNMEEIKKFYLLAEKLTNLFGEKYCVDHIMPLAKGGKHHQDNLQVITLSDNSRKGAKYPFHVEKSFNPSMDSQISVA
jgi:hypothetical protein